MANKRIIVLGAGYGGIIAAKTLHKLLRKRNDVEIILIDQNNYHTMLTELHQVAGNRVEPGGVRISLEHVLEYTKVKFIRDKIIKADLKEKKLFSSREEYNFDYLIVGVGSQPAYFNIPGMEEYSFPLWSLADASKIYSHIVSVFKQAATEQDPEERRKLLTFVVGGGGFTGIEMMGELIEWVRTLCHQYKIPRKEVRLVQIEALPCLCPSLSKKGSDKVIKYLNKKGVEVLTNSLITGVNEDSVSIKDREPIPTKTLIWTGGIKTKDFVKELGVTLGKKDRIVVNKHLQTVEYPYVYAIGDCMEFVEENGEALPALVETAMQSGECAAKNIAADILNQPKVTLKANLHGVMVSVGSFYGVAEIKGLPMFSGLLAIIMKHLVNMHYFFGIGGFELIWEYINHQFFHKTRVYNWLVETGFGHVGKRNFTFWLVPLRIWLGVMWLVSGLDKVKNGWLGAWPMLGPGGATDATASASVMSLISDHTPGWYAYIVENLIYPNALFFQKIIVITEIGLGLAFIVGFFTFIAAIVSIGMHINFALSTGLPLTSSGLPDLWWIAASFAMFAGAGRSFGVDYYLIPFLRNQFRYFQDNRKINIFKGWQW